MQENCFLVLSDGSVFKGKGFGFPAPRACELSMNTNIKSAGEVVFNTGMTGYYEILTDPSYKGQIITMTYPHIGNYGTDNSWSESGPEGSRMLKKIKAAGLVVRSVFTGQVPMKRGTISNFLMEQSTPGITEVDTRALTLRLRDHGSLSGIIVRAAEDNQNELSKEDLILCKEYLDCFPKMEGLNLVKEVGTDRLESFNHTGSPHIAVIDYGVKANIINDLSEEGCRITIIPNCKDAKTILSINPDGILFSNGPGDPSVLYPQIAVIKELIGKKPLFGICLGHQLLCLSLGAKTYKMKFGHHGINHPVKDEVTGQLFITSQNHGFAVDENTLNDDLEVWFKNANDGSIEGIRHKKLPISSVQFHPESAPGPADTKWILKKYIALIK